MAGISTCTLRGDYLETSFFIPAPLWPKLLVFIAITLLLWFVHIRHLSEIAAQFDSNPAYLEHTRRALTLLLFSLIRSYHATDCDFRSV